MKIKILLISMLFLVVSSAAFGQSISIYDIDTTNFPIMKAKFYAFDKDGNQVRPSVSELSITEDGVPRTITNVSCPPPRRIKLSVGIMVDTYGSLNLARAGTERLINFLDMPNEDELALTYMNGRASIWQDFTKNKTTALDKAKTIPNAPGVDINTMFYSDYSGGIPFIKDRFSDKKVLILVSDLHCPNLNIDEAKLIADAKAFNIAIYSVLLGTTDYSGLFKRIAAGCGGIVFENVRNETEITNVFKEIAYIENNDPCEITWESDVKCLTENIKVELNWNSIMINSNYKQPSKAHAKLQVSPSFIFFGKISNPEIRDTTITLTSINSDIVINDIKLKFGSAVITIINTNFPIIIPNNTIKIITLRCVPTDSSLNYASFEIETNLCSFFLSAYGGYPGKKIKNPTLKLTHPNGGEVFNAGSDTIITWDGISPNDTCNLEFSSDNGKSWKVINNYASNLTYNWNKITKVKSDSCLIKLNIYDLTGSKSNQTISEPNQIYATAISSSGDFFVTGGFDKKIYIWETKTLKLIKILNGHIGVIKSLAITSDDSRIVSGSYDKTAIVWDINSGEKIHVFQHKLMVASVYIDPENTIVLTSCWDYSAQLWDLNTGLLINVFYDHIRLLNYATLSLDKKLLITGGIDRKIKLWDVTTAKVIRVFERPIDVLGITFSKDNSFFIAIYADYIVSIWDTFNGNLIKEFKEEEIGPSGYESNGKLFAFCEDNKTYISAGRNNNIVIRDIESGLVLRKLYGHTKSITDVSVNFQKNKIVSCSIDNTARVWDLFPTLVLSDQSDAVFSIIAPEPQFQQLNIDMGQVVVGSTKDTMVTAVLCNVGQAPLHVLGVDVTNGNTNEFMVPRGAGDFFLDTNECRDMMFAFMPNQVGVRNAKITVKSTIGDYIDTINITGIGILPTVQIVNKFIDFGYIDVGMAVDTLQAVTIKNISKVDIDIKNTYHSEPNDKDFSTIAGGGAFKLKANETAKLDMRFLPTSIGRTSGTLMFEYDGIGSPAVVQLFGAGIGGKASLKLDTIETETSKIVEYPVKLTLSGDIIKSGANAVNLDITYNNTLLYPLENYPITNKDGFATLSFKNVPLTKEPIQFLETLRFRTGLGNAIETPLSITNFELLGTTEEIDVTLNDGNLKLTDVCYDGGVRLLNPNNTIFITKVSPNPVNGNISIDLNLIEIGYTEVAIYNIIGEKVKTIFSKDITETGSFSINSEISDLSNGQYVIIFKTPTYLEKSNILIIK